MSQARLLFLLSMGAWLCVGLFWVGYGVWRVVRAFLGRRDDS